MRILAAIPHDQLGLVIVSHLKNNFWPEHSEFHFVHVLPWLPDQRELESWYGMSEYSDFALEHGNQLLNDIADPFAATNKNMKVFKRLLFGHISEQLLVYARSQKIDEIVVATHDRSEIASFFLGSVANELIQYAPCSVTVLRSHEWPKENIDLRANLEASVTV